MSDDLSLHEAINHATRCKNFFRPFEKIEELLKLAADAESRAARAGEEELLAKTRLGFLRQEVAELGGLKAAAEIELEQQRSEAAKVLQEIESDRKTAKADARQEAAAAAERATQAQAEQQAELDRLKELTALEGDALANAKEAHEKFLESLRPTA